jgi:hypothetical protein
MLESLVSYAKQFSQDIGHDFNDRTILRTGVITGPSVFGYTGTQKKGSSKIPD